MREHNRIAWVGFALAACLLAAYLLLAPPAECDGWVCVGPCSAPGTCAGYGCVCVGYSTGVGQCVSR